MIELTRFANGPRARTRSGDGSPDPPPFWNVKSAGHRAAALFAKRPLTIAALLLLCAPAHAAGSGMPWEAPLQKILESIEGPVAKVSAVVIIIMTGLSLAFGDMSGGLRRLIQIVFGLSIAFAATSFFLSFFSFAGGALIN